MEIIRTPRGTFRYRFESMEQANSEGYYLWFTHEGVSIVGNGTQAYAVRA